MVMASFVSGKLCENHYLKNVYKLIKNSREVTILKIFLKNSDGIKHEFLDYLDCD